MNWKIHLDREDEHDGKGDRYSITTNEEYGGWNTDSGYDGYGLPKELAQWICDILNQHKDQCPYEMHCGSWTRKDREGK